MANIEMNVLKVGNSEFEIADAAARQDVSQLKEDLTQISNTLVTDTASGSIASFSDGADNVPVKSLSVAIEPVQSGTGDPSPTNIRPISGTDSVTVTRSGLNLFDVDSVTVTDARDNTFCGVMYNLVGTFAITAFGTDDSGYAYLVVKRKNGTYDADRLVQHGTTSSQYTITTEKGDVFWIVDASSRGDEAIDVAKQHFSNQMIQIEIGASASEYATPTVQTCDININSTVYAGLLDVTTGKLTVTHTYRNFVGTENWLYSSTNNRVYTNLSDAYTDGMSTFISDKLAFGSERADYHGYINDQKNLVLFAPSTITSADEWKAWLVNNHIVVVYQLATPSVIQLSGAELNTILGLNHIWSNAGDVAVTYAVDTATYIGQFAPTYHDTHYIESSNIFSGEYISGKGIRNDGTFFADGNYGVTDFIPVDAGDNIVATSANGLRYMRYITAYDKNRNLLPADGSEGTYSYWTVPEGVYYVRITSPTTVISASDFAIYRSKGIVFITPDQYSVMETENRFATRMKLTPLSLMADYITDAVSYRPLGTLEKGYICIVTDDGTSGLANYTIPLAIANNIPMTFAVMKDSEVFADQTMTATVLDAVNNHGCSLAQHGMTLWDLMSEIDLNNFFDDEKAFFDSLGVNVKGAVIPQHRTNSLVKAVAGARFGVVRSGYTGLGEDNANNGSVTNYYSHYTSGARSNIYGLSSYNCAQASTAYNHDAVDYAKASNKIMIVYYHEYDSGTEQHTVIEDLIAYAKSEGLEFITLGDIPRLGTWVAE